MNANNDELIKAATALVEKLDLVHKNPNFQAVWTIACLHGIKYSETDPSYAEELKNIKQVLANL